MIKFLFIFIFIFGYSLEVSAIYKLMERLRGMLEVQQVFVSEFKLVLH